ncbi:protein DpdH [Magnetococcales bacterium HHB-1]
MPLNNYWPIPEEINRCIKAEAEAASDAVLLAVHQSMPLFKQPVGADHGTMVSEHDLLEAFLTEDLAQGTLLMPMTGPSGVGKSHLIRWLAAQLGRDSRADHMHVIRIPKSATLREVVERVLAPLSEDPKFADVIKNLDHAIAQVSPFEAAVRFSGALEISLKALEERLMMKLKNDSTASERRTLMRRVNHAKQLPGFLNDAALREHMTDTVLAPIIKRAVSGRREPNPQDDAWLPQFCENDLNIPEELRSALGEASVSVRRYYQSTLRKDEGSGFVVAVEVLNEVVDDAVRQVFQLDQATGGITLESIILRVREILLEQGKELVLLVEDFAALSGIQSVLLNVCIREAERDGEPVLARMRTALALTDGYLVGRDTIATRAVHEWVIQSSTSKEEVIERTVALTGAYLNAARLGEKALQSQYDQSSKKDIADLTNWVGIFKDETLSPDETDQLNSFGKSHSGIPLFPYNQPAIAQLVERHLRSAGDPLFNPRKVINFILREVLLEGRDLFVNGQFPPAKFQSAVVSASIANWLANKEVSDTERTRLESLIFYWSGNPTDASQVQLSQGVFDSFGLRRPVGLPDKPIDIKIPGKKDHPDPRPPPDKENPKITQFRDTLAKWRTGTALGLQDANKLRQLLTRAIEKAFPWNRLRLRKFKLKLALKIPNARGNPSVGIPLSLATDHTDPDGELTETLLGVMRLDLLKGEEYPDKDIDCARLATLVERLLSEVIPFLEEQRTKEVQVLSWMLRRQARILGLVARGRKPALDIEMAAVTEAVSPKMKRDASDNWQKIRNESIDIRPALQQALRDRIACFQGTGDTTYAIDPTLIDINIQPDDLDPGFLDHVHKAHFTQLKNRVAPAVRPLINKLRDLTAEIETQLGPKPDKLVFGNAVSTLLGELPKVGWPGGRKFDRTKLRRQLNHFKKQDLIAQLNQAKPLLDQGDQLDLTSDTTLACLGRLDFKVIEASDLFLKEIGAFIAAAERMIKSRESALAGIDPDQDAQDLKQDLRQIHRDLSTIIGDTNT